MAKIKHDQPLWVRNLRRLMEQQNLNPRSLSLKAGLNPTAVRDMLEGRSKFPRYDTAQALASALETTPAVLMSDDKMRAESKSSGYDLELLTEIIARLQEGIDDMVKKEELNKKFSPRQMAVMTTTLYRRIESSSEEGKSRISMVRPQVYDLLDYEARRGR